MKAIKALLLITTLLSIMVAPASAGYYIAGATTGYGFGFTGFSYPTTTTTTPSSTSGASTLNTSSCLYNNCSSTTPGTTTTTTPTSSSTSTSSVTTAVYGGSSYSGYGLFGSYTRYYVYGMYNVQGTTQTPTLSGGLTPSAVIDPLANPEPTTIALFGAGLLVLGYVRKRRLSNS